MTAFKNCGSKNYFKKSIDIFKSVDTLEVISINNTLLSGSLQNVWFETIQSTLLSFDIQPLNVDRRIELTVDEVVDKRNAVSHGRMTPVEVGERFRCHQLREKTSHIQLVNDMFLDNFENYLVNRAFIKAEYRSIYVA